MNFQSLLKRFLIWRLRYVKHWHFTLFLSLVIGLLSGLVAVTIKNTVYTIESIFRQDFVADYHQLLYFIFPFIGISLAYLFMKYIIKKPITFGIPTILHVISKRNSNMKRHQMFSSIISSSLTVGFGGSVGLEAPTAVSGSAIGSNLGKLLHLNYKTRTLLIGCAAAATIASIFNAPIAGIIFAIEVIMLDLTMASLIPLLIASAAAAITSQLILGDDTLFHFTLKGLFTIQDIPFYIGLGLISGLVSLYFTKINIWISKRFEKLNRRSLKLIVGAFILGLLVFAYPPLYGEGYESINALISGNFNALSQDSFFQNTDTWSIIIFVSALIFLKPIATAVTLSAGGVGGIFAPTLFIGSSVGFIYARLFNTLDINQLSESNFTLVGMAGLMAGIMHAPLTAIFLIAEITKGYDLFIPLMIVTSISYLTVKYFYAHTLFTFKLAQKGELLTHHKDKTILSRMSLEKIAEKDLCCVKAEMSMRELTKSIAQSKRNIFPVVDDENNFLGIIAMDDIRNFMFDQSLYDSETVGTLMRAPLGVIALEDSMEKVMNTFKNTGAWNLPVLKDGKYVGYLSKSKLFSIYRRLLVEVSED